MPTDTYGQVVNSPVGRFVARRAGLPRPVELDRQTPGAPVVRGCVLLGAAPGEARLVAPLARRLEASGRVIVLGTPPAQAGSPRAATAQRALEGFTRSLGKEVGRGATVQHVEVAPGFIETKLSLIHI